MDFCSGTGQNLSVRSSDFTKDFAVVFEAFVGEVTVDFVSGDVRNSFLYCGSELDVKYMGHHYGASYIEHTKFRDAILNSTPAEVTLKDGVTSVVTGLAAHKSINEGRVVEIKELWG